MRNPDNIAMRRLDRKDREPIATAFEAQKWNKPLQLFERYLAECSAGKRDILVAEVSGEFAGYVTIDWQPDYPVFKERAIPEIADLNVLIKFQRRGIGTCLIEAAEKLISERSDTAGIRVGLTADYGNAHRMYIKRGYVPDGLGLAHREKFLEYGD